METVKKPAAVPTPGENDENDENEEQITAHLILLCCRQSSLDDTIETRKDGSGGSVRSSQKSIELIQAGSRASMTDSAKVRICFYVSWVKLKINRR